jgi:hypothetical protein
MNYSPTTNPNEETEKHLKRVQSSPGYDWHRNQAMSYDNLIKRHHTALFFISRSLIARREEAPEHVNNSQQALKYVNELLLDTQLRLMEGKLREEQVGLQYLKEQLITYINQN